MTTLARYDCKLLGKVTIDSLDARLIATLRDNFRIGLLEVARSYAHLPGSEFVNALIGDVERRAQSVGGTSDDIAVVRVERTAT